MDKQWTGVIGAGKFGQTIAHLLRANTHVIIYTRSAEKAAELNAAAQNDGHAYELLATDSLEELCNRCLTIFPVLPSEYFRQSMRQAAPYMKPAHILIHGTKGLDIQNNNLTSDELAELTFDDVFRMSQVIQEETNVERVGCLSGPNLSDEIMKGQPTATVLASEFSEVIKIGVELLSSPSFFTFGSHDLIGAELAGSFKNIIALGSGMLAGMGMGKNLQGLLIARGLREVILLGTAMGSNRSAFVGTAGIGDIVATSLSENSRNYQVGYNLGQGQSLEEAKSQVNDVAEGLRTIRIAYGLCTNYDLQTPIIETLYQSIYCNVSPKRALQRLMIYPYTPDVDF